MNKSIVCGLRHYYWVNEAGVTKKNYFYHLCHVFIFYAIITLGMENQTCSDIRIVQLIISYKAADANLAVNCIYKRYGKRIKWTLQQRVDASQKTLIEDLLTDSILAFFNAIRQGRFEIKDESSINAYLTRTAKNLLNMVFRASYKGEKNRQEESEKNEIENYLAGKLTDEEQMAFNQKLRTDTHLQEQVELKRQTLYHRIWEEDLPENLPTQPQTHFEEVEEMKALIAQLPPMQQQLLVAHYHQGVALTTFAETRKMTSEAVRQQHHRCLKKLRELYRRRNSDS